MAKQYHSFFYEMVTICFLADLKLRGKDIMQEAKALEQKNPNAYLS
jgi:hypothetical protein